jgi:hypothetical protein
MFHLSLYLFAVNHCVKKNGSFVQIVPQFFGYESKLSWPLEEEYSKWVLLLYQSWLGDIESMKIDGSYVTDLKAFLSAPDCPNFIAMAILQKELGWKFNKTADQSMSRDHNGETGAVCTDSQVTEGSQHQAALDIMEEEEGPENVADLGGEAFRDLPDGGPYYVWNTNYDPSAETTLSQYHKKNYAVQTDARSNGAKTTFTLIKGDVYKPEHAIVHVQKFLVALHLVALRECTDYWNSQNMVIPRPIPPSYTLKVQGNPGDGKALIICTTRNMTPYVMRAMDYDMATVTTGVAADLICGETHIRGYTIPTQKKVTKLSPIDIRHQSVQKKKAFFHHFARKFHVISDEYSMIGRQTFALLLQHLTEGRLGLTQAGVDTDHGHLYPPQSALHFSGGYHYLPPMVTYINYQQLLKNVYLIMCLVNWVLPMQRDASHFGCLSS